MVNGFDQSEHPCVGNSSNQLFSYYIRINIHHMPRLFVFLFSMAAFAAYGQRSIPLPPSPPKSDLCAVYDSLIYVLRLDSGLYVSNGSATRPVRSTANITAGAYYALTRQTDTLWIGTSNGLFRLLPNGTINQFSPGQGNFAADTVFSLAASGNILYAGTNAGVLVFNGSNWTAYNTSNSALTSNRVTRIKVQAQRLGIVAGGMSYLLANNTIQPLILPNSLPLQLVQPLPNGRVLVATLSTTFVNNASGLFDTIQATQIADTYVNGDTVILFSPPRMWLLNDTNLEFRNVDFAVMLGFPSVPLRVSKSINNSYYFMSRNNIVVINGLVFVDDKPNSFNRRELDINHVKAQYNTGGDMFWDRGATNRSRYNVPKQVNNNEARHTMFAFGPWFGGFHGGQLYQSAQTYRQSSFGGIVFRSGPLSATGDTLPNEAVFDRIWKINRLAVEQFKDAWSRGNVQDGSFIPPADLRDWPGNRPNGGVLAPYFDRNNDGQYRWQDGDYPLIKGDQAVWMVFNDKDHRRNQGVPPMGLEIHCMAYAFACNQLAGIDTVLNYTTFLDYTVINRSNRAYSNTYFSLWADGEVGNLTDDYIGADVNGNGFYFYNSDDIDQNDTLFGNYGYGQHPPAQGIYVLRGPLAPNGDGIDNNRNGQIDEAGEDVSLTKFMYMNNDGTPTGNPTTANQFANIARGFWRDSTQMVFGGSGYMNAAGSTSLTAGFVYTGASDPTGWSLGGTTQSPVVAPFTWTEATPGLGAPPNAGGDRRGVGSMGPFTFPAGGQQPFTLAFIYSRGNNGAASSVQKLLHQDVPRIKQWYAQGQFPSCIEFGGVSVREWSVNSLEVQVYPNPARDYVHITVASEDRVDVSLYDLQGRRLKSFNLQGEKKYQIDLSGFSAGMYLLHFRQQDGIAVKKIRLQP